jgi:hypothetical protein
MVKKAWLSRDRSSVDIAPERPHLRKTMALQRVWLPVNQRKRMGEMWSW